MKYTFKCPACSYEIKVDAQNEDEAVAKINKEGKEHAFMSHQDMPKMSEEEMAKMVKEGMKKE